MAITLGLLFELGFIRFQYPSATDFPVRGIDISRHQSEIDWPVLKANSDIDFAFIKASEGADLQDLRFKENWR